MYSIDSPGPNPTWVLVFESFHVRARHYWTGSHTYSTSEISKGNMEISKGNIPLRYGNEYCSWPCYELHARLLLSKKSEMQCQVASYIARRPSHFGGLWRATSAMDWFVSFTLHESITCSYYWVIEKGFSKGEKGIFPYLQYSFPYLREPRLRK